MDVILQEGMEEVQKALEAQGVDVTAMKAALAEQGADLDAILAAVQGGNQGLIKSIQRLIYKNSTYTGGSVAINEVDTEKCFVLFERLKDTGSGLTRIDYTLGKNALSISHASSTENSIIFGFWIVEFY